MKTHILVNILIGFLLTSCSAQNNRIENKIMECSYQSFADGGKELKKLISEYQDLLINEGIISDSSGKSYRIVLQNIAEENDSYKIPSKFFSTELGKINKPNIEKMQECKKIIFTDSSAYDMSKFKSLEHAISNAQNSTNIRPSIIAQDILDVLSDEDFEIDFYKLRTFLLFSIIDTDSGIRRKLPELSTDDTDYDLTNALKVTFNDNSEILVDNKKVTLKKLKKLVRAYESKNKSKSIISIKTNPNTLYSAFVDVQNAIVAEVQVLREQLAEEKYKKTLDKLTKEQRSVINKTYPKKIVD